MLRWLRFFCVLCLCPLLSAQSTQSQLEGYWLTRKDETPVPSSVIRLFVDKNGQLVGQVVVGFYDSTAPLPEKTCRRCSARTVDGQYGVKQGEDIVGSYSVWGFNRQDDQTWINGRVVRIKTGQVFKANMTLQSPQQLNVAVRYGIFYKTLKWERLTEKQVKSICAGDVSSATSNQSMKSFCVDSFK